GLVRRAAFAEAPSLHERSPSIRVVNDAKAVSRRTDLYMSLKDRSDALHLVYSEPLLSTNRPSRWSRDLKRLLLLLQGGLCPDCGSLVSWESAQVDHYRPLALGGTSTLINLYLRHGECNRLKSAHAPAWAPSSDVF